MKKTFVFSPDQARNFQLFVSRCASECGAEICGKELDEKMIPQLVSIDFHMDYLVEEHTAFTIDAYISSRETNRYSRNLFTIAFKVFIESHIIGTGEGVFVAQPRNYFNKKGRRPL